MAVCNQTDGQSMAKIIFQLSENNAIRDVHYGEKEEGVICEYIFIDGNKNKLHPALS